MSTNESTQIKCSDCGKTATVPFKPKQINQFTVENVYLNIERLEEKQLTGRPRRAQENRKPNNKHGLDAEKTGNS